MKAQRLVPIIVVSIILVGFFAGCDVEGDGLASSAGGPSRGFMGAGGEPGTGGNAATGGMGGVGGATGGAAGTCGVGETCGIAVTFQPPSLEGVPENPCTATYFSACGQPGKPACGWDLKMSECWPTMWCEPSVASLGSNGGSNLRPASAGCQQVDPRTGLTATGQPGNTTYTYPPGTLSVWGDKVVGSSQVGGTSAVTGYLCVPNTYSVVVNC